MKWSMLLTEDAMQFNLDPEDDHERELIRLLAKYQGPVSIYEGVSVAQCRGGYLRDFGRRDNVFAVKIGRNPTPSTTEGAE